jgi:hypothetical protein
MQSTSETIRVKQQQCQQHRPPIKHPRKQKHGFFSAIAFNRIRPDDSTSFYLRLVGFPGSAEIDRSRPLNLTTSLRQSLTAADASSDIFTDASTPEANVGQYDLQPSASAFTQSTQPALPGNVKFWQRLQ